MVGRQPQQRLYLRIACEMRCATNVGSQTRGRRTSLSRLPRSQQCYNQEPVPSPTLVRETLNALCHAKYYTKFDIIAAYNKLRIAEGHEWKTAFITRFGLFETLVMPFGLCNAPAEFQHYINHALFDLFDKCCTAYLDDVLVYSQTKKEHREHVRQVVTRLRDAGLQIDINKYEFETTGTKYLGLIVITEGIEMDSDKAAAISSWLPPMSVRGLLKFLGFANFYQRFIKDFRKSVARSTIS
jgi:Reverse transcriptase (RNA-dependent DNA polymerase)